VEEKLEEPAAAAKAAADQGVKREDRVSTAAATSTDAGLGSAAAFAALDDGCLECPTVPAAGGGNAASSARVRTQGALRGEAKTGRYKVSWQSCCW